MDSIPELGGLFSPPDITPQGFLALLDRVMEQIGGAPHMGCSTPCETLPEDEIHNRWGPSARLTVQLEGLQRRAISVRGKRVLLELSPGDCAYFAPGAWAAEYSDTIGRALGVTFYPNFVRLVVRIFDGSPVSPLPSPYSYHTAQPLGGAGLAVSVALNCIAESGERLSWSRDLFNVLLQAARKHLAEDGAPREAHGGAQKTWFAVRTYLDEHFSPDVSRESVAAAMGLHANYLSALARQVTGQSFRTAMDEVRMQHARILLRTTNLKLLKVAEQCGYTDVGNFIKAFRRVVGLTPGQFRKPEVKT